MNFNFSNFIVKINVKKNNINFNSPLNLNNIETISGTGFFIYKNLIMTCYHVIKYSVYIEIVFQTINTYIAKIKYIFPDDDIAILEINNEETVNHQIMDFKILKIQPKASKYNVVYTVGFPLNNITIVINKGIISGFQNSYIQTDATLNPGNSGGPLVYFDKKYDKYKIIGVNVSKLVDAENTNFVVPSYRFLILLDKIFYYKFTNIIYKKPLLLFDYQKLKQLKNRKIIFKNYPELIKKKIGIMITQLNCNYYLNKYFKITDILLSINNNYIDYTGFIKCNFFPEKISIAQLGYWFTENDIFTFELLTYNNSTYIYKKVNLQLEIINRNLMDYYYLPQYPEYYINKNNLIFSIITKQHYDDITNLDLYFKQKINIISRYTNQQDLFTVYLVNLDNNIYKNDKLSDDFNEYPIGDIIVEINDQKFNNYTEYINIMKNDIYKIKTINNQIFYL
uniref:Protease Do-like PDZ domain-containing protein n=1 Tax=viral metagenome TaxID=1070528 RepID=A0A6C0H8L5_9ZZZZ